MKKIVTKIELTEKRSILKNLRGGGIEQKEK